MLTCLVKYNLEKSCKHELSLAMQNLSKLGNVKVNKRTSKQMYLNVWEFSLIIEQLDISQTKIGAESLAVVCRAGFFLVLNWCVS